MNKICTSIEQSQKLIELGIDINTADMYLDYDYNIQGEYKYYSKVMDEQFDDVCIPAWSISALLEFIPPYLGEFKDGIDFGFSKSMNGKWYSAHYIQFNDNGLITFNKTVTGDTAIDAIFEMIVWLKENKKL